MLQTLELFPGVTLRYFQDRRFKQGCLSLQLLRQMDGEESAKNALLPSVLLRGTRQHPDMRKIVRHMDTLYGASVSPLVRRVGDYQTVGFYCGFMDDRFALQGDRVLAPVVDFLRQLLLEPALEQGVFRRAVVENEKQHLIATVESERNDKRVYAMGQLLKAMCRGDNFALPRLGEKEQIAAITPEGLYAHYEKILRESPVELLYVGSAGLDEIAGLLCPLFAGTTRQIKPLNAQTGFCGGEGQELTETLDVTQGKLCLGYLTPITNRSPEFAAMQVLNTLFGAGMTSKLFMHVREKLSLCYSIGSGYYGTKGIVTVSAGIDFDKEAVTRREIEAQMDACRRGDFTAEELASAREALLSGLRATHDSPGAIEGYYATAALSGMGMTPEEYMEKVCAVTAEQVAAAARTLTLHTGYFLKGGC